LNQRWLVEVPQAEAVSAPAIASSMIRRMVRAQRPHCALQPRQPYTCPGERGFAPAVQAVRTSLSLNTLQEHTIMGAGFLASPGHSRPQDRAGTLWRPIAYRARQLGRKGKALFLDVL